VANKLTDNDVRRILEDHKLWRKSGGVSGSKASFSNCDISDINLSSRSLSGFDFTNSNLRGANLSDTDLMASDFSGANLQDANLSGANMTNSNFTNADLSGAQLDSAVMMQVRLHGADLTGTSLNGADLREAILDQAKFTSRESITKLAFTLSDEQLFGVIFSDEENLAEQDIYAFEHSERSAQRLVLHLEAPYVSPIYLATFLLSVEGVFNNLYWLSNSTSTEFNSLEKGMEPFYRGVPHKEWLKVEHIQHGSIEITLATLATTATILTTLVLFFEKLATIDLTRELKKAEIDKVQAEANKIKQESKSIEIDNKKQLTTGLPSTGEVSLLSVSEEDKIVLSEYKQEIDYILLADRLNSPNPTVELNKEVLLENATDPLLTVCYKYEQLGYRIRVEVIADNQVKGD